MKQHVSGRYMANDRAGYTLLMTGSKCNPLKPPFRSSRLIDIVAILQVPVNYLNMTYATAKANHRRATPLQFFSYLPVERWLYLCVRVLFFY